MTQPHAENPRFWDGGHASKAAPWCEPGENALGTGVALGLGTRWGVFRSPWVITKLALQLSVMAVGGSILGPTEDAALDGEGGTGMLIAGAMWDVLALTAAIGLSVFKPGHALRRRAGTSHADSVTA